MVFRSIRSRLAVSFAGIALLAAIVLGAVLLAILRNYYRDQEIGYLQGNAQSISKVVSGILLARAPQDEIQSQVKSLAFLSQARIEVYGPSGQLIYDSGSPQSAKVNLSLANRILIKGNSSQSKDMVFITVGGNEQSVAVPQPGVSIPPSPPISGNEQSFAVPQPDGSTAANPLTPGTKSLLVYQSVQAGSSPFGFRITLNGESTAVLPRSTLSIVNVVRDPQSNQLLGSVQLSEGPAYGTTVLESVAKGWALASLVAVLLAALTGWYVSRRISAPVVALTDVTARMARGDLASRAGIQSKDEFGQLGRSFNDMADQVETTVTTLRQFVSDAAHELRTPLTALRANLDLALDERNARDRQVFLERAGAMVKRLEELNTNLLDLSRLEANGHGEQVEVVDLARLLSERIEIYASQAEQAGLGFEANFPMEAARVRADSSQIVRAMDNLMDNACKFTPPGGKVALGLLVQEGHVVFTVSDSGIGIPADDLPQIFQRFHRGRNTNAYPGSGLGLAIVKAIAMAHGGRVEVRSAGEGQGSEFFITLPTAEAASEQ